MFQRAAQRMTDMIANGTAARLRGGKRGLEKESLRIRRDGSLAASPHPLAWGSALTHPYITTDYSEALTELITPAFSRNDEVSGFLRQIHQFIYQELTPEELLWCSSMPCAIKDDRAVPIAQYGTSNIGRMKHVYRVGLDYRYGRRMQAIAGVHFNYSLPADFWPAYQTVVGDRRSLREVVDAAYFALIRNFRRLGWMVPLLFGNSPVVCSSFLAGRTTRFKALDACSHYLPYATSLRMSDIGYKNKNQAALNVSYDGLEAYVTSLSRAIATPYPEYEVIGLYDGTERVQLNTNILQIENEFYSYVRPKRTTRSGEKPSAALRERGVEYVEMRALDVHTFEPIGISDEQMRFLEAFLILCLLADGGPISAEEQWAIEYNELTVALRGREPGLTLIRDGHRVPITDWARDILNALEPIVETLDDGAQDYRAALAVQRAALADTALLPSSRLLSVFDYTLALAQRHEAYFRSNPLSRDSHEQLRSVALDSLARQRALESADEVSFEAFLDRYFAGR